MFSSSKAFTLVSFAEVVEVLVEVVLLLDPLEDLAELDPVEALLDPLDFFSLVDPDLLELDLTLLPLDELDFFLVSVNLFNTSLAVTAFLTVLDVEEDDLLPLLDEVVVGLRVEDDEEVVEACDPLFNTTTWLVVRGPRLRLSFKLVVVRPRLIPHFIPLTP